MNNNENQNQSIQVNVISEETKTSLKTRIITAIVAILLLVPMVLLGDWFFFGLICLIVIFGVYEIIRCAKRSKYSVALYIFTFLLTAFLSFWPFILSFFKHTETHRLFDYFNVINLSPIVLFFGIFILFLNVVIDKNFTVRDACFIFTMVVTITLGLQCALYLRYLPSFAYHQNISDVSYFNLYDNFQSSALLVYVVIAALMEDTGAYFVGIFFGKNKMNERISPKKTWEGFAGGIIVSMVFSIAFAFLIPAISKGNRSLLPGVLDNAHWYNILILSAILPLFSTLGDFVFSSIKRFYDIKDFGSILPGHGGVLDRIDSVLFACMLSASYIYMFVDLTNTTFGAL